MRNISYIMSFLDEEKEDIIFRDEERAINVFNKTDDAINLIQRVEFYNQNRELISVKTMLLEVFVFSRQVNSCQININL